MSMFAQSGVLLLLILCNVLVQSCNTANDSEKGAALKGSGDEMKIEQSSFGRTTDGQEVSLFTLQNATGMKVTLTNYGGIVTSLYAPDRSGNFDDIVLGYATLDDLWDGLR